jgi:hypothetical protein
MMNGLLLRSGAAGALILFAAAMAPQPMESVPVRPVMAQEASPTAILEPGRYEIVAEVRDVNGQRNELLVR